MAIIKFKKPRLMRWDNNAITDHNRSPLSISVERIEKKSRMAGGTLRKYVIADKRTFTCNWTMLPKKSTQAVDGYWAGEAIENFYNLKADSFTLELTDGDGSVDTFTVMFSDFSKEITKRGSVDFWQISVTMEEC